MEKQFWSVGEISKRCDIPIRTLHYDDEIGLLKSAQVDEKNGYRYYEPSQILHINTIHKF